MTATVTKNGKDKTYTISDGDGKINVSLAKGNTYLYFADRTGEQIFSALEDHLNPTAQELMTYYVKGKKIVVQYGSDENDIITLPNIAYDKEPKIYVKTSDFAGDYINVSEIFNSVSFDLGEFENNGKLYYYNSYSGTVFNDSITTSHNYSNVTIKGGYGNDTISGGEKNDKLYGGEGNDSILGGDGNDYIDGGNGANEVYGDAGNDTIKIGNSDNNIIYGGEGNDVITVGSGTGNLISDDNGDNKITVVGKAANEKKGILASNNTITTSEGDDIIKVSNGNCTINGGGGYDTLNLGLGKNTVVMNEVAFNNTFVNTNSKGKNIYQFNYNLADYTFKKYTSNRTVIETDENEKEIKHGTITTNDLVVYKDDDDFLVIKNYFKSNSNADKTDFQFNGGETKSVTAMGNDFVVTLAPVDTAKKSTINGTVYNDFITGGSNNDILKGANGNDTIIGNNGNDKIYGGNGDDIINGGVGSDLLYGDGGVNSIFFKTGDGNDTIYMNSSATDKLVFDKALNSITYETNGNDLIINYGEDSVTVSKYFSSKTPSVDKIYNGTFTDGELVYNEENYLSLKDDIINKGFDTLIPMTINGKDTIIAGRQYDEDEHNNLIITTTKYDHVESGEGDDFIYIQSKICYADGGEGNDTYVVKKLSNKTIVNDASSGGNDVIKILDSKKNLHVFFDVEKDGDEYVVKSDTFCIVDKKGVNKCYSGNMPDAGVYLREETMVERVETKDGYYIGVNEINEVKNNIVNWLTEHSDYSSTTDVLFTDGNKTDKMTLLQCFDTINWQK